MRALRRQTERKSAAVTTATGLVHPLPCCSSTTAFSARPWAHGTAKHDVVQPLKLEVGISLTVAGCRLARLLTTAFFKKGLFYVPLAVLYSGFVQTVVSPFCR